MTNERERASLKEHTMETRGSTSTTDGREPAGIAPLATVLRGTAIGIGLTVVAAMVIHLIGAAGAPTQIPKGSDGVQELALGVVLAAAVFWVLLGGAALAILDRFRTDAFRWWTVLAAIIAIGSVVPVFGLDVDTASKVTLAALHLTVGLAAWVGHVVARRRSA